MTLSVLIPTAGRPEYLDAALTSLRGQAGEIVVVEDGPPSDAVAAVCARHGVVFVRHGEHRGINVARNTAVEAATGDLLAFVDDDVRVWPGWGDALRAAASASADADVFAGPIVPVLEGPRAPRMCGREPAPLTALDASSFAEHGFAWGANMTVRRSSFARVGAFDPALNYCGDEEDWQRRLRSLGGTAVFVEAAGVWHRRTGEDASLRALSRAAWFRGRAARRYDVVKGTPPPLARELRVLAGCVWHVARWRCANGVVMFVRTAGRLREAIQKA